MVAENDRTIKKAMKRSSTTFLLVFAFISLFVGSFIIYNTFSILVTQRTP